MSAQKNGGAHTEVADQGLWAGVTARSILTLVREHKASCAGGCDVTVLSLLDSYLAACEQAGLPVEQSIVKEFL